MCDPVSTENPAEPNEPCRVRRRFRGAKPAKRQTRRVPLAVASLAKTSLDRFALALLAVGCFSKAKAGVDAFLDESVFLS